MRAILPRSLTAAPFFKGAVKSRKGNWVTAERWARILRRLGHRVAIRQAFDGGRCELMIALHARKSFAATNSEQRIIQASY